MDSSGITWRVIMNDALLDFKGIIDEEIQAYEALGELYKVKQSALVSRQTDALWNIDAQIIQSSEFIKELSKKRKEVAKYLGNENITLSEVIEKAKISNDALVESFQIQKTKIGILSKALSLQEKTNLALIKHGLIMVEKTMDIIFGAISPQKQQYDKSGHNVKSEENLISSIMEEA